MKISTNEKFEKLKIGISSCLVGMKVRYNGGHLGEIFLNGVLDDYVEWVPVCPEVESGMGVPREEVRLVRKSSGLHMIGRRTNSEYTATMLDWSRGKIQKIIEEDLDGFILTAKSPSCGVFRVRVYPEEGGAPSHGGTGIFADSLLKNIPGLPVEENGRLQDSKIRENFIERLFILRAWRDFLASDPTPRGLINFHSVHKLTFMAHSNAYYGQLGRIVATSGSRPWDELISQYLELMIACLKMLATTSKHANVLYHVMGFLKRNVDHEDKSELVETIESYRLEKVPLVVPITLLNHHLRKNAVADWIIKQSYMSPYPSELMLRNHV